MFKLDNNLLIELGLGGLPPLEKNRILAQIYETLEMRVGIKLAEGMSDQQLDEFETLMPLPTDTPEVQKQKEGQAHNWLETNFPNYKQVVADELNRLKDEVKAAAPQIISSIQAAPAPQQFNAQPSSGSVPSPDQMASSQPPQPQAQPEPPQSAQTAPNTDAQAAPMSMSDQRPTQAS